MKILLLAVGRIRSAPLRTLCEDFLGRIQRYGAMEIKEVKAADGCDAAQAIFQEGTRLLDTIEPSDQIHILDESGSGISSRELSALIGRHEMRATKRLCFVLGGAYGLSQDVKARGKQLSLSKLTLPHELCRVLMLEQLYRARTIQRGEPYHHG